MEFLRSAWCLVNGHVWKSNCAIAVEVNLGKRETAEVFTYLVAKHHISQQHSACFWF